MSECFSCLKEGLRGSATRQTRCPHKAKNGGSNPPPSTKILCTAFAICPDPSRIIGKPECRDPFCWRECVSNKVLKGEIKAKDWMELVK